MYSKEFVRTIEDQLLYGQVRCVTVLQGERQGDKVFFDETKVYASQDEGGFLTEKLALFREQERPCVLEIEGRFVLLEIFGGKKTMVVCGAGHVSQPLIRMAKMIGFFVVALEDRPMFADKAREAGADQVICDAFQKGLEQITGSVDTYFVIVTRGHRYDEVCLAEILKKEFAYVGMLGSRGRVARVKKDMMDLGCTKEAVEQLHSPIGLMIGAETPEEISVAILAEIIQEKRKKEVGCDGVWDVLHGMIEPKHKGLKKVMATIVSKRGAAPRGLGTKMLILENGVTIGTVGGGCAEAEVISEGRRMMASGEKISFRKLDMTGRNMEEEGLACGGIEEILLELLEE